MGFRDALAEVPYPLAQESAHYLGVAARRMCEAVDALRAYDASGQPRDAEARRRLVDVAAQRAWFYVLQRESMDFPGTDDALDHHGVPAEVRDRMGRLRWTPRPEPADEY